MIEDYCPFLGHRVDCMEHKCHFCFEALSGKTYCYIREFLKKRVEEDEEKEFE